MPQEFFVKPFVLTILMFAVSSAGGSLLSAQTAPAAPPVSSRGDYNVRDFGSTSATAKTLDTKAINDAIDAASAAGGGTVHFPGGTYLSYSIRLKNNITLFIDQGAKIVAAPSTTNTLPGYDPPEPNAFNMWQDFGHSHWHNSLIWGENVHDVAIIGPGTIDGLGLRGASGGGGAGGPGGGPGGGRGGRGRGATTESAGAGDPGVTDLPPDTQAATGPATQPGGGVAAGGGRGGRGGGGGGGRTQEVEGREEGDQPPCARSSSRATNGRDQLPPGTGNKILGHKNSHNITLRDVTFFRGGHFCLLATGADNLTIDNSKFDTNRDSMDIDSCKNVKVSNCYVNSPNDDGLCLKSSFALGVNRATENVTISNCQVSGYVMGSLIDGTFNRTNMTAPDRDGPTGRIKFGTESNGGFKNITITNCVFDHCRGLAMEAVDGGNIEDVTVSNLTMHDIFNSPIFIRLGDRARGPAGTPTAQIRRINISNISASDVNPNFCCLIAGIAGHPIQDVVISNVRIQYKGGGTAQQATTRPKEDDFGYPEPSRLGAMPAYGFFVRHVDGLEMHHIDVAYDQADMRPVMQLVDVANVDFLHIKGERCTRPTCPSSCWKKVTNFSSQFVQGLAADIQARRCGRHGIHL